MCQHESLALPLRAVDLASQAVISLTEYKIKQRSDMYPVGRARLEVSSDPDFNPKPKTRPLPSQPLLPVESGFGGLAAVVLHPAAQLLITCRHDLAGPAC